jgi:hypothetical protein
LLGKLEGKRPLGRPRRRWEGNLQEIGRESVGWIHLVQNRDKLWALVKTVTNLCVLRNVRNFLNSRGTTILSK